MSFWGGKRVIVTGGCGMVGRHLVPLLEAKGADVLVITNTMPDEDLPITTFVQDAGIQDEMGNAFRSYRPHAVFNLAASVSGIYYNLDNQLAQFWLNMRLQIAPLIAAVEIGVPLFLQVSTVCAYDPSLSVLREEDGHKGEPPTGYAWAKRMGEYAAEWASGNYAGKIATVRLANLYGEHDKFGAKAHVIPIFILALDKNETITLTGDGSQTREFLHAEDAALGMMAALEHGANGRIYNLGTNGDTQVSIRGLAEKLKAIMGSNSEIITDPSRPIIDQCRHIVSHRANSELIWTHKVGLDEGLRRTVDWYKQSRSRRGIEVAE